MLLLPSSLNRPAQPQNQRGRIHLSPPTEVGKIRPNPYLIPSTLTPVKFYSAPVKVSQATCSWELPRLA